MSHSHTHSVEHHLHVSAGGYDADIRRFVPHYDEAIGVVASELGDFSGHVLDVGTGTGALIAPLAKHCPRARFTGLDVDPQMLGQARKRLAEFGERVQFTQTTFLEARGPVDAVVASLSLHHVESRAEKVKVYAHLRTIAPVLISSDAMVPNEPSVAQKLWDEWTAHLIRGGDSREEAQRRFESWKREDFYFSVEEELAMLREAGFGAVELRWRRGPLGVIVARG